MESDKINTGNSPMSEKELETLKASRTKESKFLKGMMVWMVNNVCIMAVFDYIKDFLRTQSIKEATIIIVLLLLWFLTGSLIVTGIAGMLDSKKGEGNSNEKV